MLAYILSIAVALASAILFFSAFFAPKLHRKDDFLWSGVGFFYGLVLWLCAGRVTGGVLLGQMAAVVLVLSFAWQTISLRAAIANPEKLPGIKTFSLLDWIGGGLGKKKAKVPPSPTNKAVGESQPTVPDTDSLKETIAELSEIPQDKSIESVAENLSPEIIDLPETESNPSPRSEFVAESLGEKDKQVESLIEKTANKIINKYK